MQKPDIDIIPLGQVGFRYRFGDCVVYVDPYLSHSVEKREDSNMVRMHPVPLQPNTVTDADYIFITHSHRDHCDEDTLGPMLQGSPSCRIVGPEPVCKKLRQAGVPNDRLLQAMTEPVHCDDTLLVYTVPAAHPEIELLEGGGWWAVGYVFEYQGCRFYHAGDTSLRSEIIDALCQLGEIDTAFLPVNEQNYYKDRQGIIGNMSIREAFYLAESIKSRRLVPTHWDMFAINQVFPEEIDFLYQKLQPNFVLEIMSAFKDT